MKLFKPKNPVLTTCPKCQEVYKIGSVHQCKLRVCGVKDCRKPAIIWTMDDSFNLCELHAKKVKIENCRFYGV